MPNVNDLAERYLHFYPKDGVDPITIRKIEDTLKIKLPDGFCQIACFYSGGLLGGISCFAIAHKDVTPNIVDETIRLRYSINLPSRFIVIAEPPESLIVMDTEDTPSIIWCDASDAERIADMSFVSKPQVWNDYVDFFSRLLEDEEEEQT